MIRLAARTLPVFAAIIGFAMALAAYLNFSGVRTAYLDLIRARAGMIAGDIAADATAAQGFGIRLNKEKPDINIRKTDKGGVVWRAVQPQRRLEGDMIRAICSEYRMSNCEVHIRYPNATVEDLIDVLSTRTVYIPALFVLNKIDAISIQELELYSQVPHYVPLSAKDGWNMDELLEKVWDKCKMIRIYTKPKGQFPNFAEPVILHNLTPSVEDFCNRIHKGMVATFKHAWVWGRSVKHQPQRVGIGHILADEDVIQIVKK